MHNFALSLETYLIAILKKDCYSKVGKLAEIVKLKLLLAYEKKVFRFGTLYVPDNL